jgi:hypothetical protein
LKHSIILTYRYRTLDWAPSLLNQGSLMLLIRHILF